VGTIAEDGLNLPKDESGATLGFAFVQFEAEDKAAEAIRKANGYKLDKSHTFIVNSFEDYFKYMAISDQDKVRTRRAQARVHAHGRTDARARATPTRGARTHARTHTHAYAYARTHTRMDARTSAPPPPGSSLDLERSCGRREEPVGLVRMRSAFGLCRKGV